MLPVNFRINLSTSTKGKKKSAEILIGIGFPGGSDNKESACNAGDLGLIPGFGKDPLEEDMATHSQVFLPRESPWTEEPGRLQSMGLQRVGHD